MEFVPFNSYDDLKSNVTDTSYYKNQFCFAYGFKTFDMEQLQFEFDLYFATN
jgi:hypothetical protein